MKVDINDIINDMVIVMDTREQKYDHILDYLDSINVPYIIDKLDSADYSFILPNYPQLGLDKKIFIERKGSLDELAGNFTKGRERFTNEFERLPINVKIHLVLENMTWAKLLFGSYRSKFSPVSYMASLLTWSIRYDCKVWNCTRKESPILIYNILKYELLENLKKGVDK